MRNGLPILSLVGFVVLGVAPNACSSDSSSTAPRDGAGHGGEDDSGGSSSIHTGGSTSQSGGAGRLGSGGEGGAAETGGESSAGTAAGAGNGGNGAGNGGSGAGNGGNGAGNGGNGAGNGGNGAGNGGATGDGATDGDAAGAAGAGANAGGGAGEDPCDFGEVASAGSNEELDLFGAIAYFAGGEALPAGHYRATYLDGCMKYASDQAWTIHAYAGGSYGWWFVGDTSGSKVVLPPGTVGYSTGNGAYATFDECVAANLLLAPVEFDFAGGKLGVWLQDSPYSDNLAGVDNRNPKWNLVRLDCQ